MQITYFGYGSLVNTRTLGPQASAVAGTLDGWRREWRAWWRADGSAERPGNCTLTVRRDPQSANTNRSSNMASTVQTPSPK